VHWDSTSETAIANEIAVALLTARFGGNANNTNCSPRYLNANNSASNANANNCGSAKIEQTYKLRTKLKEQRYRGQESRIITRQGA
jgi:hypothetical protein